MNTDTLDLIERVARIPSFSSWEERLHPLIRKVCAEIPGAHLERVPLNNLLLRVAGRPDVPPVALSAHLDKINHFGPQWQEPLPVRREGGRLVGQMDDSVGVGLCLALALRSRREQFPPLQVLLSEMEEGTAARERPGLLKDGGAGRWGGMGAEALAGHLLARGEVASLCVTIDTTPLFRGRPGVALYSGHWELNGVSPTPEMLRATARVRAELLELDPGLRVTNNGNDYVTYGRVFASAPGREVVSVAVEPAIFPYHQSGEGVFLEDIGRVESLLAGFLRGRSRTGF